MKVQWFSLPASIISLLSFAQPAASAEACLNTVEGIQIVSSSNGSMELYVYSREIMAMGNGSTYLYYSGHSDVAKTFYAQFLFAKAGGHKLCVSYQPGTPAYRWVLTSVGVAGQDAWPWQ